VQIVGYMNTNKDYLHGQKMKLIKIYLYVLAVGISNTIICDIASRDQTVRYHIPVKTKFITERNPDKLKSHFNV